jgi:hypothetical protein
MAPDAVHELAGQRRDRVATSGARARARLLRPAYLWLIRQGSARLRGVETGAGTGWLWA